MTHLPQCLCGRCWTDQEKMVLRQCFAVAIQKHILSKLPGRSWYSIEHIARNLGLRRWARRTASLPLSEWSELDSAYLAGLIDGEGCIMFMHGEGAAKLLPNIKIDVTMTHEATIAWVADRFGQNYDAKKPANARCKPAYRVATQGERACRILERLLPFLRTKGEQANLAISYWHWRRTINPKNPGNLSPDLMQSLRRGEHLWD